MVELKGQLSRHGLRAQLVGLEHLSDTAKIVRVAPDPPVLPRRWRLADRLGEEVLRALVEDRRAGSTNEALAAKYKISVSSVKRVLKRFN